MSHIFVSNKARESTSLRDALHSITPRHKNISGEDNSISASDADSLPYIAILAELGQPSSFSVTFPERNVEDRCLRIYAAGVDTTTYPFLVKYPALMRSLQDLVHIQQIPETKRPYTEHLNAQVKFGSTATPEHMEWEHEKNVPNVRKRTRTAVLRLSL